MARTCLCPPKRPVRVGGQGAPVAIAPPPKPRGQGERALTFARAIAHNHEPTARGDGGRQASRLDLHDRVFSIREHSFALALMSGNANSCYTGSGGTT